MRDRPVSRREARHQTELFLEETVCDLIRREHANELRCDAREVLVGREFYLGRPGLHADIRFAPPGRPPLFAEVKEDRSTSYVQASLSRKYDSVDALGNARRIVLVTGTRDDEAGYRRAVDGVLPTGLEVEVVGPGQLHERIQESYGVSIDALSADTLPTIRRQLDHAKWNEVWHGAYPDHPLRTALLWHLGYHRIARLRDAGVRSPDDVLVPELYRDVVVLLADISGFSSYVRDTRDHAVVRNRLAEFYSNARSAALAHGGMLYQFVGDEAIVLFGVPDGGPDIASDAVACASDLIDIGNSVSTEWQRRIDRVQSVSGVHIGISMGDLEIIPERPLNPARVAAIGDAINLGARLRGSAASHEVLVSNTLYQALPPEVRGTFREAPPVEGRNLGLLSAWSLDLKERSVDPGRSPRQRYDTGRESIG